MNVSSNERYIIHRQATIFPDRQLVHIKHADGWQVLSKFIAVLVTDAMFWNELNEPYLLDGAAAYNSQDFWLRKLDVVAETDVLKTEWHGLEFDAALDGVFENEYSPKDFEGNAYVYWQARRSRRISKSYQAVMKAIGLNTREFDMFADAHEGNWGVYKKRWYCFDGLNLWGEKQPEPKRLESLKDLLKTGRYKKLVQDVYNRS